MRVALISTPFIRMPPCGYGGTELFCSDLAEGLTGRGHDVTVFTTGDSALSCRVRALYAQGQWPPTPEDEVNHASWAFAEIARDGRYDVVHLNCTLGVPFTRFVRAPAVLTIHHMRVDAISRLYARHPEVTYVAISERQRSLEIPLPRSRVIHHGVLPARYPPSLRDEGYLVHIGRYAPEKGTHLAVDIACEAGLPLRLAGRVHPQDQAYYAEHVAPRMQACGIEDLGEADHEKKVALLRGARALLCPLQWEEPFGLIAIEAMLCGTPVLGFRRGSFPEIVEEGITGILVEDGDTGALARAARSAARFSSTTMVAAYEELYASLIGPRALPRPRAA